MPSPATEQLTAGFNADSNRMGRSFLLGLISIALVLLTAGIGAFWYLTENGSRSLLESQDRPIARAAAFIPDEAPFSFSLLANPDKLVAQQQAVSGVESQQVLAASQEIERAVFKDLPIDYDRDIRPWVGDEITVACTQSDLDFDDSNGLQPGYLIALEIAPMRSQQAKESLQFFWQAQTLGGRAPQSKQLNGVRLLYSRLGSRSGNVGKTARSDIATALVGEQFVLFANDAEVIRRSLRATETATNLAQNRAYRQLANQLPQERLGLAHFKGERLTDTDRNGISSSSFATASLELKSSGLAVTAQLPNGSILDQHSSRELNDSTAMLRFIPASSAIALVSQDLSKLDKNIKATGVSISLPDFLTLKPFDDAEGLALPSSSFWSWVKGDYAIAQNRLGSDDWILVVPRSSDGVAQLDELAESQGYNAIPLDIEDRTAIAWTKFKARAQRRQPGALETEILGLHLQKNDSAGDYEIFASSIAAMDDAIGASENSLLSAPGFIQATTELKSDPNRRSEGYLYMDWAAATSIFNKDPTFERVEAALHPITRQIDALSATRAGSTVNLFLHFR